MVCHRVSSCDVLPPSLVRDGHIPQQVQLHCVHVTLWWPTAHCHANQCDAELPNNKEVPSKVPSRLGLLASLHAFPGALRQVKKYIFPIKAVIRILFLSSRLFSRFSCCSKYMQKEDTDVSKKEVEASKYDGASPPPTDIEKGELNQVFQKS